jgi:hypothetical protein
MHGAIRLVVGSNSGVVGRRSLDDESAVLTNGDSPPVTGSNPLVDKCRALSEDGGAYGACLDG